MTLAAKHADSSVIHDALRALGADSPAAQFASLLYGGSGSLAVRRPPR